MNESGSDRLAGFYNERFRRVGDVVEASGWASRATQWHRFDVLFRRLDASGSTVLDVGCALGDLIPFLDERFGTDYEYVGVDVASELVDRATTKYADRGNCRFEVLDATVSELPTADLVVSSGAFTYEVGRNDERVVEALERMWRAARQCVAVNFMTSIADFEIDKNHHFDPAVMLSHALGLTRWVTLHHDYELYEFTLQVFRGPQSEDVSRA